MLAVEFLGQACASIRFGDVELISDPWFSGPTHLDSWRAYPQATGPALEAARARIDRATHIYISHDHTDHFDRAFLRSLAPKTLVVSDFRNRHFLEALRELTPHHKLSILPPATRLELAPGYVLRIVPEQPRFRTNSIAVLETPFGQVINANDCGINTASLGAIAGRGAVAVFMYTLNFMANGYPFPYLRRDDADLRARMDTVRHQVVDSYRSALDVLQPAQAVAFAGPVTFADPINAHLTAHPEALDWSSMVAQLCDEGANLAWPAPHSTLHLDAAGPRFAQLNRWEDVWAQQPPPPPDTETVTGPPVTLAQVDAAAAECARRVSSLLAESRQHVHTSLWLSAVADLDMIESADPSDYAWTVHIRFDGAEGHWERLPGQLPAAPSLHIVSTADITTGFMEGRVTMDDLLLSARARFSRDPDSFDSVLHNLLRFGHDDTAAAELVKFWRKRSQTRATITVDDDGKLRTIPKFCPHESESLERANVCAGRITCPRHKWVFDLETGACLEGGDHSMNLYGDSEEPA